MSVCAPHALRPEAPKPIWSDVRLVYNKQTKSIGRPKSGTQYYKKNEG